MRKLFTAATALTLIAVSAALAACGGDDDTDNGSGGQTSDIRTAKGLTVASLNGDLSRALTADDTAEFATAPEIAGATAVGIDASMTNRDIAQTGYVANPAQALGTNGITIIGYGTAATDPDAAIVEFYFSRDGYSDDKPIPFPEPVPPTDSDSDSGSGSSGSSGSGQSEPALAPDRPVSSDAAAQAAEVAPIIEADLQPVVDALTGAGVAADDIEFIGSTYHDPYYASATIRATITNLDNLDATVEAGNNAAASLGDILLQSTNISYTLSDCAALERAAMEAAVEDAGDRGAVLADVLGVGLGSVVGAVQYSYSPYGATPCNSGSYGPIPIAEISYRPGTTVSSEVSVYSEITVTYAIN